jgi:hypothetical protein
VGWKGDADVFWGGGGEEVILDKVRLREVSTQYFIVI